MKKWMVTENGVVTSAIPETHPSNDGGGENKVSHAYVFVMLWKWTELYHLLVGL